MATRAMDVALALTLASVLFARHASAQSPSCTTAIMTLAPCLGFITGNASAPLSSCCTQLGSVVKSQARCLCTLLDGTAPSFGISINRTQALALPGDCKVQTPAVSRCNATAPAESPPATQKTPVAATPTSPSGKGSNTVPTGESSSGNTYKSTRSTTISVLFLVLCVSCVTF